MSRETKVSESLNTRFNIYGSDLIYTYTDMSSKKNENTEFGR